MTNCCSRWTRPRRRRLIAVVKEVMEGAADPACALDVPLVVDAGQGANWAEAH
jgi:DNA polymerase-1